MSCATVELAHRDLPADGPRLLDALFSSLEPMGHVVIHGVPTGDNAELLRLANALGDVTVQGTSIPGHPLEDGCVYRVEPVDDGRGVRDEDGLLIFSTTTMDFAGHTDGYHRASPPAYVLLLCVRPDLDDFGASIMIDARSALALLPPDVVASLRSPVYPSQAGPVALVAGPQDAPSVRFNLREIERFTAKTSLLQAPHTAAVQRFAEFLASQELTSRHVLEVGDCLLVDNRRVVHARTALSPRSRRLLKRVWVESPGGMS